MLFRFANRLRAAGRLLEFVSIPGSKHGSGMMPKLACFKMEKEAWRMAIQEYLLWLKEQVQCGTFTSYAQHMFKTIWKIQILHFSLYPCLFCIWWRVGDHNYFISFQDCDNIISLCLKKKKQTILFDFSALYFQNSCLVASCTLQLPRQTILLLPELRISE